MYAVRLLAQQRGDPYNPTTNRGQRRSPPPNRTTRQRRQQWATIANSLGHSLSRFGFISAVQVAYSGHENAYQLVLADFVWAARTWFLCDPVIDHLNTVHPRFGSHILTTLQQGPRSSFLLSAGLINLLDNAPTTTALVRHCAALRRCGRRHRSWQSARCEVHSRPEVIRLAFVCHQGRHCCTQFPHLDAAFLLVYLLSGQPLFGHNPLHLVLVRACPGETKC